MKAGRVRWRVHRFILDRRFVRTVFRAAIILPVIVQSCGFCTKMKRSPYPGSCFSFALGQGIVEEQIPQIGRGRALVDQLHIPVEARGDREDLGQRRRRIDPVEQRERQFRVLPHIGGDAILARPARMLPPDRGGHQAVCHDPPCDDERRFPAEIEWITPRGPPQGITAAQRHADAARRIGDHAMIGQMRKKRRLPPRAPAIGPRRVAKVRGRRQAGVCVVAEG